MKAQHVKPTQPVRAAKTPPISSQGEGSFLALVPLACAIVGSGAALGKVLLDLDYGTAAMIVVILSAGTGLLLLSYGPIEWSLRATAQAIGWFADLMHDNKDNVKACLAGAGFVACLVAALVAFFWGLWA